VLRCLLTDVRKPAKLSDVHNTCDLRSVSFRHVITFRSVAVFIYVNCSGLSSIIDQDLRPEPYLVSHMDGCLTRVCVKCLVFSILKVLVMRKGNADPQHTYGGAGGRYSSSFSTVALDGGEWPGSRPGRALLPGKRPPPVPIGQEAGWAPELIWTQRLG
jgi:hypothetical protein